MAAPQPVNVTDKMTSFSNHSDVMTAVTLPPPAPAYVYGAKEYIILSGTPVIVILGTIFNALSVAVLLRPRFRKMSTTVYLIGLAITDTIYLFSNSMTKNFIKIVWSFNYSTQFPAGCAIYVYLLLSSRCIGAWFIVSVTVERLIVISLPIKAKIIATRKRALILATIIAVVLLLGYSFIFEVMEVSVDENGKKGCDMKIYYVEKGIDFVQKMIDMVIYSILPTVALFGGNAVIVYKVAQSSNFRKDQAGGGSGGGEGGDDAARRLTIMLLSVSTAFLALTLPLAAFLTHATLNRVDNFEIYYRSCYLLQLANSAINFVLYTASGPAFRRELFHMFGCSSDSKDGNSDSSQQTRSKVVSETT